MSYLLLHIKTHQIFDSQGFLIWTAPHESFYIAMLEECFNAQCFQQKKIMWNVTHWSNSFEGYKTGEITPQTTSTCLCWYIIINLLLDHWMIHESWRHFFLWSNGFSKFQSKSRRKSRLLIARYANGSWEATQIRNH